MQKLQVTNFFLTSYQYQLKNEFLGSVALSWELPALAVHADVWKGREGHSPGTEQSSIVLDLWSLTINLSPNIFHKSVCAVSLFSETFGMYSFF